MVTALISPTVAGSDVVVAFVEAIGSRFKFTRVYNRIFEILLVISMVLVWKRLDLGGARVIGFRRAGWGDALVGGLIVGSVSLAIGLVVCWLADGLVVQLRYDSMEKTVRKTLQGLAAALIVGTAEEALFRGVLLRRSGADFGRALGVAITTFIYAIVHVLRAGDDIALAPGAGVERTLVLFAPLADPTVWPTIAGLAGLGLVLAWARIASGTLWLPIGIHVAWVAVFRVGRVFFKVKDTPVWMVGAGWPPLIGGVAGLTAVVVTALLLRPVLRRRGRE